MGGLEVFCLGCVWLFIGHFAAARHESKSVLLDLLMAFGGAATIVLLALHFLGKHILRRGRG